MEFYQQKKRERGAGKAICATARNLLTVIFVLLKQRWTTGSWKTACTNASYGRSMPSLAS